MNHRMYPRVKTASGEVQVWFPEMIPFSARLLNLSEGGCLLSVMIEHVGKHVFQTIAEGIKIESRGRMMLRSQACGTVLCLTGVVRSSHVFNDREIQIGTNFDATDAQRAALKEELISLVPQ